MAKAYRWFPGYTVAGVAALAYFATAPGQTFIISQLNLPLRHAFDIGETTLNYAYAAATIAAGLPLVYVGRLTDNFGPRHTMALIAFLFGAACVFMASVGGAISVFVAFFLLRFLGQASLSMVSQHAIAMWFHRRLGSIHALLQVVVFGLWILLPQMAVRMIEGIGWRETYIIFGLAIWISVIPLALLLVRNRPDALGLKLDGERAQPAHNLGTGGISVAVAKGVGTAPLTPPPSQSDDAAFTLRHAMRTRAYWTLAAIYFVTPLIGTAFLFDIQPMLLGRGMTIVDAANTVSAWTATMCIMALPSGLLTDRVRPSLLLAGGMIMIGLSVLILMLARSPIAAAGAMVAFGIGHSIVATCSSTTLARYFGRRHHGAIRSSTLRIGVIGTGLGTVFTGASLALTGAYEAAMISFMLMCLPLIIFAARLRSPPLPDASPAVDEP